MTNNQLADERLVKILSETQATIMEHNSRCVRGSVEVDARLFESMIMELQVRRKAAMDGEPVAWGLFDFSNGALYNFCSSESRAEQYQNQIHQSSDSLTLEIGALYRHAQPAPEREQVRREHAEWSQSTFGNVGPVGPLKHLSKEALEAAAAPDDLSEWADMQFLLWDAQRRAGITDEQITQAMIEKLAVNKQREWPEPKEGEPRLHIKEQPAPVGPVTDAMVYAFHHALTDGPLGDDDVEDIKTGLRAAFATVTINQPAPVVPDESYQQLSDLYHAQEKRLFKIAQRIKGASFDKYAHTTSQAIDVLEAAIFGENEACRAAMLQAGTLTNEDTNNCREIAETPTGFDNLTFDEHRKYIGLANIEIRRFQTIPDKKYIADLLTIAVNSLYESINTCGEVSSPVIPEWIPVSERMPEEGQHIIIFCDDAFVLSAQHRDGDFFDVVRDGEEFFETTSRCVTHWMPLPAAPQEVKGD